jgi:hypothetical protein
VADATDVMGQRRVKSRSGSTIRYVQERWVRERLDACPRNHGSRSPDGDGGLRPDDWARAVRCSIFRCVATHAYDGAAPREFHRNDGPLAPAEDEGLRGHARHPRSAGPGGCASPSWGAAAGKESSMSPRSRDHHPKRSRPLSALAAVEASLHGDGSPRPDQQRPHPARTPSSPKAVPARA